MAVVTVITTGDMRRMFADCRDAVVAGTTRPDYLGVVNHVRWDPRVRVVAILADIRRLDVIEIFTRRVSAIVAAGAIARDIDVIEIGGQPASGRVAVIAIRATGDMARMLADRRDTVMT